MIVTKRDLGLVEEKISLLFAEFENIKNHINVLNKNQSDEMFDQSSKLDIILNHFEDLNNGAINIHNKEVDRLTNLNIDMQKRINSFKIMENLVAKKFSEEIQSKINEQIKALLYVTNDYKVLQQQIVLMNKKIMNLTSEMEKLQNISTDIKSADFTLSKTAKEIRLSDSEKVRLVQENEKLKRIISGMRKNNQRHN